MPLYEYKCVSCKKTTEELFSHKDRPETIECQCGKEATFKMSTDISIVMMDPIKKVIDFERTS